jgi:GNAT superfamily N-acetyltransferase
MKVCAPAAVSFATSSGTTATRRSPSCAAPSLSPDAADPDFLTLRDGSTAAVHVAGPGDREALADFFGRLSLESRWRRFLSLALPRPELISSLCDCSDPRSGLTLLATRVEGGQPRILAAGSYLAKDKRTAEVAMAVAADFQGKGLGTLLLERLALLAVRHGFTPFWAVARAENQPMLEVLRESGFALTERPERGEVEVDLALIPTEAGLARLETRHRVATVASLSPFFRPRSVAVVGASRDPSAIGHRLLDALVRGEFRGRSSPSTRTPPRSGDCAPTRPCGSCLGPWTWPSWPSPGTPSLAWWTTASPGASAPWS